MSSKKQILVTGASGLIGSHLCPKLEDAGYEVVRLSRSSKPGYKTYSDDLPKNPFAIIHLAGAGIADKRWSVSRKKELISSRTQPLKTLESNGVKPQVVVSASGMNAYGSITTEKILDEKEPFGKDFIGECTRLWEQSVYESNADRHVCLRTPLVLTKHGGGLAKMMATAKFGVAGLPGGGNNWISWVHIDDLCSAYIYALDTDLRGSYNVCSSSHDKMKGLISTATKKQRRRAIKLPVPSFVMKLMFGELSSLLLSGFRADSSSIRNHGLKFAHDSLQSALSDLYKD